MAQRQSIGRNAVYLMLTPFIFGIVDIFISGYVARTIGTVEYGRLVFALGFINFFTLFTNLGFNNYLMNEFAMNLESAGDKFIPTVIIRSVLAVLTYVAGIFFINILGYPVETKIIYYAAGLIVLPEYLTDSCEGVFKGRERMKYIASIRFMNNIAFDVLRLTIVYLGYKAYGLAWCRVIVSLLGMMWGFYYVYKYFLKIKVSFQWSLYKQIIRKTLPFALPTTCLIIYNRIDIILISYFSGDKSVAYYKSAYIFIERISIVAMAIVGAVYPAISRLFVQNRSRAVELYNRSFVYLFLVSFPMAVGGILLSDKIILFVFGEKYIEATLVLKILCACIPVIFANNIMGNILMATNQTTIFTRTIIILSAANVIGDLALIPYYAHVGSAVATLVAQSINLIILTYMIAKRFGALSLNVKFLKIIASGIFMGYVLYSFFAWNLIALIFLGVAAYFLSILLLKTFKKEEFVEIKNMLAKKEQS